MDNTLQKLATALKSKTDEKLLEWFDLFGSELTRNGLRILSLAYGITEPFDTDKEEEVRARVKLLLSIEEEKRNQISRNLSVSGRPVLDKFNEQKLALLRQKLNEIFPTAVMGRFTLKEKMVTPPDSSLEFQREEFVPAPASNEGGIGAAVAAAVPGGAAALEGTSSRFMFRGPGTAHDVEQEHREQQQRIATREQQAPYIEEQARQQREERIAQLSAEVLPPVAAAVNPQQPPNYLPQLKGILTSIPNDSLYETIKQSFKREANRIAQEYVNINPRIFFLSPDRLSLMYDAKTDMIRRANYINLPEAKLRILTERLERGPLTEGLLGDVVYSADEVIHTEQEQQQIEALYGLFNYIKEVETIVSNINLLIKEILAQGEAALSLQDALRRVRDSQIAAAGKTRPLIPKRPGSWWSRMGMRRTTRRVQPPAPGAQQPIATVQAAPPRRSVFQRFGNLFRRGGQQQGGHRITRKRRLTRRRLNKRKVAAARRSLKNRASGHH